MRTHIGGVQLGARHTEISISEMGGYKHKQDVSLSSCVVVHHVRSNCPQQTMQTASDIDMVGALATAVTTAAALVNQAAAGRIWRRPVI